MWSFENNIWSDDLIYRWGINDNFINISKSKKVDGNLEITLEVPGCGPEDINVFVCCENGLNVNGRIIDISNLYDVNQCSANVKNGLLTLKIPKKDHQKIAVTGV